MFAGRMNDWFWRSVRSPDEGFHQEILSAACRGIRIVAAVEAIVALLGFTGGLPFGDAIWLLLVAVAIFAVANLAPAYPHTRVLAALSASVTSAMAVRSMHSGSMMDYQLGSATCIMLAAVTAVPLLPVQAFCMGLVVVVTGLGSGHALFLAILGLVVTTISAALLSQRSAAYCLYLDTLRVSAELRDFQSKTMREESSGTMVRMTGALAHELSSPVGVLSSGISTLFALCGKLLAQSAGAPPHPLQQVVTELKASLETSLDRLRSIVNRIQRVTSLDESSTQPVNLNDLAAEAVALMKPRSPEGTRLSLELQPVPDVTCKGEQLVAVLCSLLANSFQAVNGEGVICIRTAQRDSRLELTVTDNGRGIPPERLAHIFDPRFQVMDGRVSTGNWSLFTSRQYMLENNGDIRIESQEGKGTKVCLTLRVAS
jgi:signal transduction histidine kinase